MMILDEEARLNKELAEKIWEMPEIQNQIALHPDDEFVPLLQLVDETIKRLKEKSK